MSHDTRLSSASARSFNHKREIVLTKFISDIIGILLSHSLTVLFILVDGLVLKALIWLLNIKILDGNCLVILLALDPSIVQSKWEQLFILLVEFLLSLSRSK